MSSLTVNIIGVVFATIFTLGSIGVIVPISFLTCLGGALAIMLSTLIMKKMKKRFAGF